MSLLHIKHFKGPLSNNKTGAVVMFDSAGYPKWTADTSTALLVPVGTTTTRPGSVGQPTALPGMIRYNSEISSFEGFGPGNAWGSLGGVTDVDQDTKILAESSAGANENKLMFYTGVSDGLGGYNSIKQAEIGNTYFKLPSGTDEDRSFLVAENGMFRYNTTLKRLEVNQNDSWTQVLTCPEPYTGNAKQVVRVNELGTDLEFFTFPSAIIRLTFRVNFTGTTPSSVAELPTSPDVPQNWSVTISGSDLIVDHYMNRTPLFVFAAGYNDVSPPAGYVIRATTASGLQIKYYESNLNQCRVLGVTTSNTSTNSSTDPHCYVHLYFITV